MSETPQNPNSEDLTFTPEEINEINSELFKRFWKMFRSYSQVKRLLKAGVARFSEDMETEISTVDWNYVFRRNLPEYLNLSITKRPTRANENYSISEERIDLIYSSNLVLGEKPLIQHDVNFAGRLLQPSAQRNNSEAVRKVIGFVSELEKQI
jgi:hypothetical protein